MKNITFIVGTMHMSGSEMALRRLVGNIDRDRFRIRVLILRHGGKPEYSFPDDVEVDYTDPVPLSRLLRQGNVIGFFAGIYYRFRIRTAKSYEVECLYTYAAKNLRELISGDCVICFEQNTLTGVLAAANSNADKKILWVHSSFRENMDRKMYSDLLGKFDHICCVSDTVKKMVDLEFPMCADKSLVIYNLADAEKIRQASEKSVPESFKGISLLTVGRLCKEKGQQFIPGVTARLLDRGYNVFWYLIGDGDYEYVIRDEIRKNKVEDHVILLGTKKNPFPYMKKCDFYVQPSLREGFGLTVQEAKILRKPIVASDIPAFREQITDGENGILAKNDPESMCSAISRLISDRELTDKIRDNLCQYKFDNQKELEKLYHCILS